MHVHERVPSNPGGVATRIKSFSRCHAHSRFYIQHGEEYAIRVEVVDGTEELKLTKQRLRCGEE